MLGKAIFKFLFISLFCAPFISVGSEVHEADTSKSEEKTKSEIKAFIDHHLDDSYSYTIWHAMGIEFPLPVILVDEGLHVFSSSKFHHGESVAESNGKFYTLYHNKIYRTNAAGDLNFDEDHHPTNVKPLDLNATLTKWHLVH